MVILHVTGKVHSVTSPLTGGPSVFFQGHIHVTRGKNRGPLALLLIDVPIEHLWIDHAAASDSIFPCDTKTNCIRQKKTELNGLCTGEHPHVTRKSWHFLPIMIVLVMTNDVMTKYCIVKKSYRN